MRTASIAIMALAATSCTTDELTDTGNENAGKQEDKMTIHVTTGQNADTRVAYDDNQVDNTSGSSLTWQQDDKLVLIGTDKYEDFDHSAKFEFNYKGAPGATSGHFEGSTGNYDVYSWTAYYPHNVTVEYWDATLSMEGQKQLANNSTEHLRDYILLKGTTYDLKDGITMEMQNCIMKFVLRGENLVNLTSSLKRLVWTTGTEESKVATLEFEDGAFNFNDANATLIAYLAFMPDDMKVEPNAPFSVTLIGDHEHEYVAELSSHNGITYEAGKRYTIEIDGSNLAWERKLETMKFTVKVDDNDKTFNIPFPSEGTTPAPIVIDWGDGSEVKYLATGTPLGTDAFNHVYATAGTYTISISSGMTNDKQQQIPQLNFYKNTKLIRIDTPLLNTEATDFSSCFYGCTALGSIPEGLFDKNSKVTIFYDCFRGCINLKNIPKGLFKNNSEAVSFESCFENCKSLQNIPADLFSSNSKAEDFDSCFEDCQSLESIPEGLFDKNSGVVEFNDCFRNCIKLQSIPKGLFKNNSQAENFENCFKGCIGLKKIPADLFSSNRYKEQQFKSCFENCQSLESIPGGLFDRNTSAKSFERCFYECTSLKSVPEGLFIKNYNVETFAQCFEDCKNLVLVENMFHPTRLREKINFTGCFLNVGRDLPSQQGGVAPRLWDYKEKEVVDTWEITDCFKNVRNVTNSDEIPDKWKGVIPGPL